MNSNNVPEDKLKFDKELRGEQDENINMGFSLQEKKSMYMEMSDRQLLQIFKRHNSVSDLIFEGIYAKSYKGNFGFFKQVSTIEGVTLTYPSSLDVVDNIFIPSGSLVENALYKFEVELAKKSERDKYNNPFLLQTKRNSIELIEELHTLEEEIKIKEKKLAEIKNIIENEQPYIEEKLNKITTVR